MTNANLNDKYGLNDTKRIKKKHVTLILYSFTPSDMNFQTILLLSDFGKNFVTQNLLTWTILTFKSIMLELT